MASCPTRVVTDTHLKSLTLQVDILLRLPSLSNTTHTETDSWVVECEALVNGKSVVERRIYNQGEEVCIMADDVVDKQFLVYGGRTVY